MIIYKATNIQNGKVYIGQTTKTLDSRRLRHIKQSNNANKCKSKFHKAIKSYGYDKFDWQILDVAGNTDELNNKEIDYINKYDSINSGYNMIDGGTGGYNQYAVNSNKKRRGLKYEDFMNPIYIDEVKKSQSKFAKTHNEKYGFDVIDVDIQKEWASLGNKARIKNGYTHSDETKKKISESQKGISFDDRYGKEESDKRKKLISEKTREAMSKLDKNELQRKAEIGKKRYWIKKHENDRQKILNLKKEGYKVKEIISKLNISTPTYYKRVRELEKLNEL